ncbi:hypothetical protein A3Q56_06262 [Intoshia linei]|uniref:SANT domain-containing protein n=1 Tax=Intoshia linei TaxID=1819745 RepID=A0A177AV32_9BILA|nr:hypothetical protein A3Q56_06262 [Intoshia linei]
MVEISDLSTIYHTGDYIFYDKAFSIPYKIGRIDKLHKMEDNLIEARIQIILRHDDILKMNHENGAWSDTTQLNSVFRQLNDQDYHKLKHRHVYMTKIYEIIDINKIRSKCFVSILNSTLDVKNILNTSNFFYYYSVFDQHGQICNEKKKTRIGQDYQAVEPFYLNNEYNEARQYSTCVWERYNKLDDSSIKSFIMAVKCIETFIKTSNDKEQSLHVESALSSKDVHLMNAYDLLHLHDYDIKKALLSLTPNKQNSPKDSIESWPLSDIDTFESCVMKYGKDFDFITKFHLKHRDIKEIVDFYYNWKCTHSYDFYKQDKKRHIEKFIPCITIKNRDDVDGCLILPQYDKACIEKICYNCKIDNTENWYTWGPISNKFRLCQKCWDYWKYYSALSEIYNLDGKIDQSWMDNLEKNGQEFEKCVYENCKKYFSSQSSMKSHLAEDHGIFYIGEGSMFQKNYTNYPYKPRSNFMVRPQNWIRLTRSLIKSTLKHSSRCYPPKELNINRIRSVYNSVIFSNHTLLDKLNLNEKVPKPNIKDYILKIKDQSYFENLPQNIDEIIKMGQTNEPAKPVYSGINLSNSHYTNFPKTHLSHLCNTFAFKSTNYHKILRKQIGNHRLRFAGRSPTSTDLTEIIKQLS